jgi:predicted dehydrogenase
MSQPIRIGILGAARVAPYALIDPARRNPAVSIAAVASRSLPKAQVFAARHAIARVFDSYADLLGDDAIDAVYIALPPAAHSEWTLRALEQGKHVLCEKPLATSAGLADAMVAAARRRQRILQEGMHTRYSRALQRQRALTLGGTLGRVVQVASTFRHPNIPMLHDDFRLRFDAGGGAALDLGCYAVTALRYVTGQEPVVRDAISQCCAPDVDCWMQARLALPSGATATVECGFRGDYDARFGLEVECERGAIRVGPMGLTVTRDGQTTQEAIAPGATYQLQLDAFVHQMCGEVSEAPPDDDAVATARVIDAMYERAGLAPRAAQPTR